MKTLASTPPKAYNADDVDDIAMGETQINNARASIASKFGIRDDAVDVVARDIGGKLQIVSASIFLSASDVRKITGQTGGTVEQ